MTFSPETEGEKEIRTERKKKKERERRKKEHQKLLKIRNSDAKQQPATGMRRPQYTADDDTLPVLFQASSKSPRRALEVAVCCRLLASDRLLTTPVY